MKLPSATITAHSVVDKSYHTFSFFIILKNSSDSKVEKHPHVGYAKLHITLFISTHIYMLHAKINILLELSRQGQLISNYFLPLLR